jgi:DNA-3-methyladenine glycosylase II
MSIRSQMRRRKPTYDTALARRHLIRSDPVMRGIAKSAGPLDLEPRGTPYVSIVRAILYQQLAGAAAAAIERRFLALYGGRVPDPAALATATDAHLRTAGISRQKAGYFRSIGEHFASGELSDRKLMRMPDDEVIDAVTRIKGVGRWTADMFLMFCLGRPDVLPVGDLGIQSSMRKAYGLGALPKAEEMLRIADPWRPYRSAGSWYLWRYTDIVTM